jgi:hypothetical protein
MKKIILASAILFLASCKDKSIDLAKKKTFFLESKDSVLGCFEFGDRSRPFIIFQKNDEDFNGKPQSGIDEKIYLNQSGDSLFIVQNIEVKRDKYGNALNEGEENRFLTTLKEDGNLDEKTLIENSNKGNFFNLGLPIQKITVKAKK